jgi:hypothetical protein
LCDKQDTARGSVGLTAEAIPDKWDGFIYWVSACYDPTVTHSMLLSYDEELLTRMWHHCGRNREQRPWISIGDAYDHKELTKAWSASDRGLKKLSDVARKSENRTIFLIDSSSYRHIAVSVELEIAEVDGVQMYCVDLKFGDFLSFERRSIW